MMGEDQLKGYPNESKILDKKIQEESLEDRKERVLKDMGIIKDKEKINPENKELVAQLAMRNKEGNIDHRLRSIEQDVIVLRTQINEIVIVLNKLQTGFVSKLSEMQGRIDTKLDDIKRLMK